MFYNRDKAGSNTGQALTALAEELDLDFLVVGAFGRKGDKLEMLGMHSQKLPEHIWL